MIDPRQNPSNFGWVTVRLPYPLRVRMGRRLSRAARRALADCHEVPPPVPEWVDAATCANPNTMWVEAEVRVRLVQLAAKAKLHVSDVVIRRLWQVYGHLPPVTRSKAVL